MDSNFKEELYYILNSNIEIWTEKLQKLGMNEDDKKTWMDIYKTEIEDLLTELNKEVEEKQKELVTNITELLKEADKLCQLLSIKMPQCGSKNLGLYDEEKELTALVNSLQLQVDKRLNEINTLIVRQNDVSKCLGIKTTNIPKTPLPSAREMENFTKYIEGLENEKFLREEKYLNIKCEILDLNKELEFKPSLDFERIVLSENDNLFKVSDNNMMKLEKFYNNLKNQLKSTKEEVYILREQIRDLWEILEEDLQDCDDFLKNHPGHSLETLQALKLEVKRLETIKKENIEVFINKLRKEIQIWWDKLKYTVDQCHEFRPFGDTLCSEDLLSLHDLELTKLKKIYEENKDIYTLLEKRDALWGKFMELEDRSNQVDRYKNRGGQLLKEEKERNVVTKKIKHVEDKLLQLAAKYEIETGQSFMYWGENVEHVIKRSHDNYENDKKEKLSVRKHQRDFTLTPGLRKFASTSTINARTPLKLCNSVFVGSAATPLNSRNLRSNVPHTSAAKSKQVTPLRSNLYKPSTTTKSRLVTPLQKSQSTLQKRNVTKTAPPKIQLNNKTISKNKISFSKEKKKKKDMLRRISKYMESKGTALSNYDFFEGVVPIAETSDIEFSDL